MQPFQAWMSSYILGQCFDFWSVESGAFCIRSTEMQVAAIAENIGYGQLKCQQRLVVVTGGSSAADHLLTLTIRPVLSGFLRNIFQDKHDLSFRKLRNPTSSHFKQIARLIFFTQSFTVL